MPVAVKLLGLVVGRVHVVLARPSLAERALQDGGDVSRCRFLDVSQAPDLCDQLLIFRLCVREAATELMQKHR